MLLSYGLPWNVPDEDEEETPEVSHYEVYETVSDKKVCDVSFMSDGSPNQYQLMSNPYFAAMWGYFGSLRYDYSEQCWWSPASYGSFKVFELRLVYKQKGQTITDTCKKCKVKGVFIRTALVCPSCRSTLGGF